MVTFIRRLGSSNRSRNFLLFLPAGAPSLGAVITYYSATANVNQEGDVHINDTLQGFGTAFLAPQLVDTGVTR